MLSFDTATFETQMPDASILLQTLITPAPESSIAAANLVIGTYFSDSVTEVLQMEDNPLGDGGKISIDTQVREVDWLAEYLKEVNATWYHTLFDVLRDLDWSDSPM